MIKNGYLEVNGSIVRDHLFQISDEDKLSFTSKINDYIDQLGFILFNKPRGVFTNCKTAKHATEVIDLLPKQYRGFSSIGRLDKDSEGLILFTNDGIFANQFLNSGDVHERRYLVWTKKQLHSDHLRQLSKGVLLSDGLTLPAKVHMIDRNCYEFILTEGRNRQIRRMVEYCGTHVIRLKRTHFSEYSLGKIKEGAFEYQSLAQLFKSRSNQLLQ